MLVIVGVLVCGGGGVYLGCRTCCASKAGGGGDVRGQDWTAAGTLGAGDTFGDELQSSFTQPTVLERVRVMLRRMRRRGGMNEGIAMGRTMQFHTLEDF